LAYPGEYRETEVSVVALVINLAPAKDVVSWD
jgi:hypothetical protein